MKIKRKWFAGILLGMILVSGCSKSETEAESDENFQELNFGPSAGDG